MTIFAVIGMKASEKLAAKVAETFPNDFLALNSSAWLVSATSLTAKDISDKLGLSEGTLGALGVVITLGGYFGRAEANVWEWISAKGKAS